MLSDTRAQPGKAQIEGWLADVKADPRRYLDLARAALEEEPVSAPARRCGLHRVCAAAALDLDDPRLSRAHARQALREAQRARDERLVGLAEVLVARAEVYVGALNRALRHLDHALPHLDGTALGSLHIQRMVVLYKMGRLPEALEAVNRGLALLDESEMLERAKALNNRAVLQLYLGGFADGLADFVEAERLYRSMGLTVGAAEVRHNRGMMLARVGDVPAALRAFDESEAELLELGAPIDRQTLAKAEVLLAANLFADVRDSVRPAVASLEAAGMITDAAEGRLSLAQALAAEGDPAAAAEARAARAAFSTHRRRGWAAIARLAELHARYGAGERGAAVLRLARQAAAELERTGQHVFEPEAVLMAGRIAVDLGRDEDARELLERVARDCRDGPALRRVMGFEAQAVLRTLDGESRRARSAVERGLQIVEAHQFSLGATDLRAHASAHGESLAAMGVRLAVDRGTAGVLHAVERWRASSLRLPPARPPDDSRVAELLAQLRTLQAALRNAEVSPPDQERHLARIRDVEAAVRRATHHERGDGQPGAPARVPSARQLVRDLRSALGGRALVELFVQRGQLMALAVSEAGSTLQPIAPAQEVMHAHGHLAFALRRLAVGRGSSAGLAAARASAEDGLRSLAAQLLAPIQRWVGDRELVIVPTAALHALPWGAVFAGRAVSVSPSALLWLRAVSSAAGPPDRLLVAGPGLSGAREEIDRLTRTYPSAIVLRGSEATLDATASVLGRAGMAHIAAHGSVRWDNPLFSALELADGPVTVYDLQRLPGLPRLMVLSACNTALSSVRAGDEVLGLAGALLSLGVGALIASVIPVPDLDVVPIMEAFHAGVACGEHPAAALAAARREADGTDAAGFAAGASFLCLGAG